MGEGFKLPEFLTSARFWFALVNGGVILSKRFGVELTYEELAAINAVLIAVFNVPQRTQTFLAQLGYRIKVGL